VFDCSCWNLVGSIVQRKKKDDEGIFVHSHAILLIWWRGSDYVGQRTKF